jgi:hypothetical protein
VIFAFSRTGLFYLTSWPPVPSIFLKMISFHSLCLSSVILALIFFIHLLVDGHLSWFHKLTAVNSAVINMSVQISLWQADFDSFGYIPRSGTAGHWEVLSVSKGISSSAPLPLWISKSEDAQVPCIKWHSFCI